MPRSGRSWKGWRVALTRQGICTTHASSAPTLRFPQSALGEALAREASGYTFATLASALLRAGCAGLDRKAPWFHIKEDWGAAPSETD